MYIVMLAQNVVTSRTKAGYTCLPRMRSIPRIIGAYPLGSNEVTSPASTYIRAMPRKQANAHEGSIELISYSMT